MSVDAVSGPKIFTSRAYTDNGNEYRRSNYGKIAGTTLGVGAGTYVATRGAKAYKEILPLVEKSGIVDFIPALVDQISQGFNEGKSIFTEAEAKEMPEIILKYGKRFSKGVIAGLSTGAVLLGLGIGGIGDGITNIIKRRNADKAAKAEN